MTSDATFIQLTKGDEKYMFLFTDENSDEVLRTLGRWASHDELSFSWMDAAVVSERVRNAVCAGKGL